MQTLDDATITIANPAPSVAVVTYFITFRRGSLTPQVFFFFFNLKPIVE